MNSVEVLREVRSIRDRFVELAESGDSNAIYYDTVVQHMDKLIYRLRRYMEKRVANYYTEAPDKVKRALMAAEYARDRMGLRTFDVLDRAARRLK